jgi:hypothetical protein
VTATQTRQALLDAFADDPFGDIHGPALADSYEEAGEDDMAAAVRWMVRHRKSPYRCQRTFDWWDHGRGLTPPSERGPEDLPTFVFGRLAGGSLWNRWCREYLTLSDAISDLAQALAQIGVAP